ncbi:MAG TPA: glycosyltransferase family 2 protein [Saprospiraceae bacterium]|nr:glycosyltransferase family 2 protein [Saprospiraceae bacterium]HPI05356.1 glycosyltransferase family 2 protein [Saprospiraceae bacterium]
MSVRLHVIVPCYNPPPGWEKALAAHYQDFSRALNGWADELKLVVVNDGPSTHTQSANFAYLKELLPTVGVVDYAQNRGKGYALRQGVASTEADFYLVTDADFPYTIDSMIRVAQTLKQHGGIAAGNRDTTYYERVPLLRKWLSQFLRWMLRNILRQPIDDSQCGLKGFDNAGKAVFLKTTIDRFLFDLEFLMLANGKVPVTPVQVELRESVVFSAVSWKILATEGRNFLWLLLRRGG